LHATAATTINNHETFFIGNQTYKKLAITASRSSTSAGDCTAHEQKANCGYVTSEALLLAPHHVDFEFVSIVSRDRRVRAVTRRWRGERLVPIAP
jgi:hypothetical protein